MYRDETHQIDEDAERIFEGIIPRSWLRNKQWKDYAKDYLVETAGDDNKLTGSSLYVQVKGTEKIRISADRSLVKFSLESKYASYYDTIKDLPVFLVVVDVITGKAYYEFLQPMLAREQSWRNKGTVTIRIPVSNDVADTAKFRTAIDEAKRKMLELHPVAIPAAVEAQKARIREIDPRFDASPSFINEQLVFTLEPKEPVLLNLSFHGDVSQKLEALFGKGEVVAFGPGEVTATGSKLFEQLATTGGSLQCAVNSKASITLVCRDGDARELNRLVEISGKLTGGQKQLWFDGALEPSPVSVRIGPIAPDSAATFKFNWQGRRWNGQRLLQLAYFDQLFDFFKALTLASQTDVEWWHNGNRILGQPIRLSQSDFVGPLTEALTVLDKARKVAKRFDINPVWTVGAFDQDAMETAEELYAIFLGGGFVQRTPGATLTATYPRGSLKPEALERMQKPTNIRITSDSTYEFMGQTIQVGLLAHDYTSMTASVKDDKRLRKGDMKLVLKGIDETMRTIHPVDDT